MMAREGKVVIVGGSAAGLRCAARLRRLQPARPITIVEQHAVFSVAACGMPYVLSGDIPDARALRRTADGQMRDTEYFATVKDLEVLAGWRVTRIDVDRQLLHLTGPEGEQVLAWDDLVLATGARARPLPGHAPHTRLRVLHSFADLGRWEQEMQQGLIERVAIIGAGLVGCELVEAFQSMFDAEVALFEAAPWPLSHHLDESTGAIVTAELERNAIDLRCGAPVDQIEADEAGVRVSSGAETFEADVAVVALGFAPATELAQEAGVALGRTGAIHVDEHLATSVPHIWAVGDCTEVMHVITQQPVYRPLGSLANRQGRTLANILAGRDDAFPPIAGAGVIKVFDLNVAYTGLTLSEARKHFSAAQVVWTTPHDKADYWPESSDLFIQLVFDADSRLVLGVQVVGPGECAKRVDVATQLLSRRATLTEFTHLEHAYAPPYAPAMEPLAQAAMTAENQLDGIEPQGPGISLSGRRVLDVRRPKEREELPVPAEDVLAIEQGELRQHLDRLESGPWAVICARGPRSAEAARLLQAHGKEATYVGGGLAWLIASGKAAKR
jgi:NADPH-dependent 2,4-dienoyl-CoA reductase/sulfur reductase-like enzyme/rhodanese-related sulfurtransferase